MDDDTVRRLGAKLFGKKTSDVDAALTAVEPLFPLSPRFREILVEFGGAVVFDNGAKYKPDEATPFTKVDGYNSLEMLYGLGSEKNSITKALLRHKRELPLHFVPIGEAPGGNLLCVNAAGGVFLWDHESERGDGVWQVAASLDHFLEGLEPDESDFGNTKGIVEAESFLDF